MLICITVRNETAAQINDALAPMADGAFEVSVVPADDEMSTVEVQFEEERDVTVIEGVSAILAFAQITREAM